MLDVTKLKKIPTRYEAQKKFFNRYKIYYYFSSKWKEDNTHEYYLFDIRLTFEKNFELMQKKFENKKKYSTWNNILKPEYVPPLPFFGCFLPFGWIIEHLGF